MNVFDILKNNGIFPGSIAISKAGRDAGRIYIVLDVGEKMAYVADGQKRTLSRPKKKRVTHLRTAGLLEDWNDKAAQLKSAPSSGTDRMLRKWISEFSDQDGR